MLGWIISGCSRSASEPGATGTSGAIAPAVGIETSSNVVTVENRSGVSLRDVRVTINPVGGTATFTNFISRLEPDEKRNVSFSEFRNSNGGSLNRLSVRPNNVVVSALDLSGHEYEVTVPWQR